MNISLATVLGLVTLGLAAPAQPLEVSKRDLQATDNLMFGFSMDTFLRFRKTKTPSNLDWSSDGCSMLPDTPFANNCKNACDRHVRFPPLLLSPNHIHKLMTKKDFGCRNFKAQKRFTRANKAHIDDNFRSDMFRQCEHEGGLFGGTSCEGWAKIYHMAVRKFGRKWSIEAADMEEFEGRVRRAMEGMDFEDVEMDVEKEMNAEGEMGVEDAT